MSQKKGLQEKRGANDGMVSSMDKPFDSERPNIRDCASGKAMAATLIAWFAKAKRPLPWRVLYRPYSVWISEMMLQQTQMERGVAYYLRWMKLFPTIASVAKASEAELLKAWEGLGYYRRVRNIQAAAKIIVAEHGGVFPSDFEAIRALPGIGDYSAGAIASIAFEQDVPAVDANVLRVFARLFDIDSSVREKATQQRIRGLVMETMPQGQARDFNQALMELGALVCGKNPQCDYCPLAAYCESLRLGIALERPVGIQRKASIPIEVATGVLVHDGQIYVQRRPETGVWAGFWELPGGRIEAGESPEEAVVREFMEETGFAVQCKEKLAVIRHGYTTYRVTLHCFVLTLDEGGAGLHEASAKSIGKGPKPPILTAATAFQWLTFDELVQNTLPAGHRKLIDKLQRDLLFQSYLSA